MRVDKFAQKENVDIDIKYMGSIDMTLMLSEQGAKMPYDAVWPANSLWISLGDRKKAVKHLESIMRSPVVFGVRKNVAERLKLSVIQANCKNFESKIAFWC